MKEPNPSSQPADPSAISKRPRRRFRFGLRTFFVLLTLCAVPLGLLSIELVRMRRQQRVVAHVNSLGGTVLYDHDRASQSGDTWLRRMFGKGFRAKVVGVRIDPSVRRIDDLSMLAALPDLDTVYLNGSDISPTALLHVAKLPKLRELSLWSAPVTDESLRCLADAPHLRILNLNETIVSEDSVKHIKRYKHLEQLFLFATDISPAAGKELTKALPKCHIQLPQNEGWAVIARIRMPSGEIVNRASGSFRLELARPDKGTAMAIGGGDLVPMNLRWRREELLGGPIVFTLRLGSLKSKPVTVEVAANAQEPKRILFEMQN